MTRLSASPAMKRAAVENHVAGRVDQARRTERERAQEAAMRAQAARIVAVPCDSEEGSKLILRCMAREVHARMVLICGQHEADTLYASIARKGAEIPSAARTRAHEQAERLFAANDEKTDGRAA